jgi:hypothetical protein
LNLYSPTQRLFPATTACPGPGASGSLVQMRWHGVRSDACSELPPDSGPCSSLLPLAAAAAAADATDVSLAAASFLLELLGVTLPPRLPSGCLRVGEAPLKTFSSSWRASSAANLGLTFSLRGLRLAAVAAAGASENSPLGDSGRRWFLSA